MSTNLTIHPQYRRQGNGDMKLAAGQYQPENANGVTLTFKSREYNDTEGGSAFNVTTEVTIYHLDDATAGGLNAFARLTSDQRQKAWDFMEAIMAEENQEGGE